MKYMLLYKVVCYAYGVLLRPVLLKAIDDPNQEWDDALMKAADALFDYQTS